MRRQQVAVAQPVIEKAKAKLKRKVRDKLDSLPSLNRRIRVNDSAATGRNSSRSRTQSELDAWDHEESASQTMESQHNAASRKRLAKIKPERVVHKLTIITNPGSETGTPV